MKLEHWIIIGLGVGLLWLLYRRRASGATDSGRIFTGTAGEAANSIIGEIQAGFDEITRLLTSPKDSTTGTGTIP